MHKDKEQYKTQKMTATINYIDEAIDLLTKARNSLDKMESFHQEQCLAHLKMVTPYIELCQRHCDRAITKRHDFLIKNSNKEK